MWKGQCMKKIVSMLGLMVSLLMLSACGKEIPEGNEGVFISKPYFFGHGGVQSTSDKTGYSWMWWTTSIVLVDMRPVKFEETFEDVITSDNIPVNFSAYIILKVEDGKSHILVDKYGKDLLGLYKNNLKEVFRTKVRREAQGFSMTALTTDRDVDTKTNSVHMIMDGIAERVNSQLQDYINKSGLPVTINQVIISKATPPESVRKAISDTAAQQQRKQTEQQRRDAELARKEAETERANADNAYRNGLGLTPAEFAELLKVEMCMKDDSCTMIMNIGGGTAPSLLVDPTKSKNVTAQK